MNNPNETNIKEARSVNSSYRFTIYERATCKPGMYFFKLLSQEELKQKNRASQHQPPINTVR